MSIPILTSRDAPLYFLAYRNVLQDNAYPLPDSYPRFFSPALDTDGYVSETPNASSPSQLPILTRLYTSSALCPELHHLEHGLKRISLRQLHEYTEGDYGLAQEDMDEAREVLLRLADVYENDATME